MSALITKNASARRRRGDARAEDEPALIFKHSSRALRKPSAGIARWESKVSVAYQSTTIGSASEGRVDLTFFTTANASLEGIIDNFDQGALRRERGKQPTQGGADLGDYITDDIQRP
jgi:hypothetical protein